MKSDLVYSSAAEEALKKMKTAAEKEGLFKDIEGDYLKMLDKLKPNEAQDLEKYKTEILDLLENEIVSRYYFQKGRTLNSFKHDKVVLKALEIFVELSNYHSILKD